MSNHVIEDSWQETLDQSCMLASIRYYDLEWTDAPWS